MPLVLEEEAQHFPVASGPLGSVYDPEGPCHPPRHDRSQLLNVAHKLLPSSFHLYGWYMDDGPTNSRLVQYLFYRSFPIDVAMVRGTTAIFRSLRFRVIQTQKLTGPGIIENASTQRIEHVEAKITGLKTPDQPDFKNVNYVLRDASASTKWNLNATRIAHVGLVVVRPDRIHVDCIWHRMAPSFRRLFFNHSGQCALAAFAATRLRSAALIDSARALPPRCPD